MSDAVLCPMPGVSRDDPGGPANALVPAGIYAIVGEEGETKAINNRFVLKNSIFHTPPQLRAPVKRKMERSPQFPLVVMSGKVEKDFNS